jgi:hypothetical protein
LLNAPGDFECSSGTDFPFNNRGLYVPARENDRRPKGRKYRASPNRTSIWGLTRRPEPTAHLANSSPVFSITVLQIKREQATACPDHVVASDFDRGKIATGSRKGTPYAYGMLIKRRCPEPPAVGRVRLGAGRNARTTTQWRTPTQRRCLGNGSVNAERVQRTMERHAERKVNYSSEISFAALPCDQWLAVAARNHRAGSSVGNRGQAPCVVAGPRGDGRLARWPVPRGRPTKITSIVGRPFAVGTPLADRHANKKLA